MTGSGAHTSDMVLVHTRMPTPGLAMLECGRMDNEMARVNLFTPITSLSESSSMIRSHRLIFLLLSLAMLCNGA